MPRLESPAWSVLPMADNPRVKMTAMMIFENNSAPTTSIQRRSQCRVADQVQLASAIGASTTKATSATSRISITKYRAIVARIANSIAMIRNPPLVAWPSTLVMSTIRRNPCSRRGIVAEDRGRDLVDHLAAGHDHRDRERYARRTQEGSEHR